MKVGLFSGKFLPLHSGHIQSIIEASTQVDKLYVIGSYRDNNKTVINGKKITQNLIEAWLTEQFKGLNHIKVLTVDETNISEYPNGWEEWSKLIKETLRDEIQQYASYCDRCYDSWIGTYSCEEIELLIFGGEPLTDGPQYENYFTPCKYIEIDPTRQRNNIRATDIRNNLYGNWNYLPSIVRQTFLKKVLITGTESTGKSTIVRYLAKIFNTSWSEEVGRYYARDNLNGKENLLSYSDFSRIAWLQKEQDLQAYKTANKLVFIDTDAIVTNYYCKLYCNNINEVVESIALENWAKDEWDLILYMEPDVPWIDDNQRLNGDQETREELNKQLKGMYPDDIVCISGNYHERLMKCIELVNELIKN
ncbi:MAG: multifunctional transcriptional regulator/nicotinamide-nucleotide adenylyltransferase/ribosylnicotinamide kinase NadR [Burkholderiales bacterium]|nr:multifunctional transcriptional regulator/nicotinamide-nucleotide adenylyltransferase/ribosylnicotinamide kinase NadR [Burkholderiales bacterium]